MHMVFSPFVTRSWSSFNIRSLSPRHDIDVDRGLDPEPLSSLMTALTSWQVRGGVRVGVGHRDPLESARRGLSRSPSANATRHLLSVGLPLLAPRCSRPARRTEAVKASKPSLSDLAILSMSIIGIFGSILSLFSFHSFLLRLLGFALRLFHALILLDSLVFCTKVKYNE